jgi:hypothetical protein
MKGVIFLEVSLAFFDGVSLYHRSFRVSTPPAARQIRELQLFFSCYFNKFVSYSRCSSVNKWYETKTISIVVFFAAFSFETRLHQPYNK